MSAPILLFDPADALSSAHRDARRAGGGVGVSCGARTCRGGAPAARAVILAASSTSPWWTPILRDLVARAPGVPRVVVASLGLRPRRGLLEAARLGAALYIAPSPHALRDSLGALLYREPWTPHAADALHDALQRVPGAAVRELLAVAAAHGARPIRVAELAGLLGVSARTLARRCATLGCPPPHALLAWGRLLHAATLGELAGPEGRRDSGAANVLALHARGRIPSAAHVAPPRSTAALVEAFVCVSGMSCGTATPAEAPRLVLVRGGRR